MKTYSFASLLAGRHVPFAIRERDAKAHGGVATLASNYLSRLAGERELTLRPNLEAFVLDKFVVENDVYAEINLGEVTVPTSPLVVMKEAASCTRSC